MFSGLRLAQDIAPADNSQLPIDDAFAADVVAGLSASRKELPPSLTGLLAGIVLPLRCWVGRPASCASSPVQKMMITSSSLLYSTWPKGNWLRIDDAIPL